MRLISRTRRVLVEWTEYHEQRLGRGGLCTLKKRGANIQAIAGRNFVDWCEGCGDPILDGEKYVNCGALTLCRRCTSNKKELAELQKEVKP